MVVIALVLSGCASSIVEGYVGQDITSVAIQHGLPANVFDLPDGRTAFQRNITSSYAVPATPT